MTAILIRISERTDTLVASILALAICLVFVYYVIRRIAAAGDSITNGIIDLAKHVIKEVPGTDGVAPYERFNGRMVSAIFVLALMFGLLLFAQSVKATIWGGDPPSSTVAGTFLSLAMLLAGSTLLC